MKIFILMLWSLPIYAGEVLFDEEVKIPVSGSENEWFASPHKVYKKLWYFTQEGTPIHEAFVFDNGPDQFGSDLIRFKQQNKIGLLNQSGKILLPAKYLGIEPVSGERVKICLNGRVEKIGEHSNLLECRWIEASKPK